MILTKIIEEKKREVEIARERLPLEKMREELLVLPSQRSFRQAVSKERAPVLIAEIKKASPSAGTLRHDFDPLKIAQTYRAYGAGAISVVTDERFFKGSLSYMDRVKKEVYLPVLRKDFVIDRYQIYESKFYGADAVLLIAGLLSRGDLLEFAGICGELAMDAVVEVHNEEDLAKALSVGAAIIGINNRNLHTFEVDLEVTSNLVRSVPEEKIVISESGIHTYEDVMFLKSLGVSAVLIGEAFMRSADIGGTIREIMGY